MSINSRRKGAVGEREFCQFLKELGFEARRSQQYCGDSNGESADIICEALSKIHFEVKRKEAFSLYEGFEQAVRDAGTSGKTPVVAHRRNNKPWVVIMDAKDFIALVGLTLPPPDLS